MPSDPPPTELVEQLDQNVGTPPPVNDPATDMKQAVEFHMQKNNDWMMTMKNWWDPNVTPGP
jgi:hypothetical protein